MTIADMLSDFFRQRRDLKEISEPKAIQADELFVFGGWIRTTRTAGGGRLCFISVSDGSTIMPVQVVIDDQLPNYDEIKRLTTGASIIGRGTITKSPAAGQEWEIVIKARGDKRHDGNGTSCSWPDTELYALARCTEKQGIHITGLCDGSTYPLAKKSHNKEFLRQIQHLRPRTIFFQSVIRLRSFLSISIHKFFEERGYQYIQTPIITCADAEGGADLFWVSSPAEMEHYTKKIDGAGKHPYFFSKPAYLTCSGQLSVESFACGLSKTYTFGPTFRSEQSHTNKHLSEFWMIEPEIAFADLQLVIETATAAIKYCINEALRMCRIELTWLQEHLVETSEGLEPGFLINRLERLSSEDVVYLPYKEALKKLREYYMSPEGRKHCEPTMEPPALDFGEDLSSEMERLLTNDIFPGKAVAVVRWPRHIKAFYMKQSEAPDEDCCESVDILYPQVGELIGGSAREDDRQALIEAIKAHGLDAEQYAEYIDLRKYGTVPHGGFGIGFERLVMLVTGVQNIRDVIPYPRTPGQIMG